MVSTAYMRKMVAIVSQSQSKREKDPDKRHVYKMEGKWISFNVGGIKLKRLRQLIRLACELYEIPPPAVKKHSGKEYSYSDGVTISFNKDHMNHGVALHEVAHHIVDWIWLDDDEVEGHGREFQGVYQWLMKVFGIAPEAALRASWEAQGLQWKPIPPNATPGW